MQNTQARRRPQAAQKNTRRRKKGIVLGTAQMILALVLVVALMGGSFGLGWYFGVDSTKFYGDILLVNSQNRLDANYEPPDLVNLYEMRHSFRLANSSIYLTRECYQAMEKMFAAAEDADMNGYIVTSGYRDYQRQAEIYAESEPGYAQEPGASEHQTGLAFDVTVETAQGFESTPQYAWLMENAHKYGFVQRYPANKVDKTGIAYEPWHYRYVGVEAAKKMKKTGMCLEEFLAANAK